MAIDLNVCFTGLCGFVPKQEIATKRTGNKMRVVLPVAAGHAAAILVNPDDIVQKGRDPNGITHDGLAVFFLRGEELRVDPPGGPDKVSIDWRDGDLNPCPSSQNGDFRYVARLEEIHANAGKMRPVYVVGNGGGVVSARVDLEAGMVSTRSVSELESSTIIWKMEPKAASDPRYEQALAEEVGVFRKVDANLITILSRRLGGRKESLLLKLQPSGGGGRVEVFVKNLPPRQIFPEPAHPRMTHSPDVHFFYYYRLSGSSHGRIPEAFSCKTAKSINERVYRSMRSVDNPKCPPAQYAAHAGI
jgi:hypothetical protein